MAKEKKRALGRGLSSLLVAQDENVNSANDAGAKDLVGNIVEIAIDKIVPYANQPRTYFDETALEELAQSIREIGIIQPITVRKNGDKFELISGERRYRASQLAGLESIPAFVRLADDAVMLEMALVENIQREDLDAIEVALSFQRLIDEINLTQEEMSKRVGKNRSTITNYLRLLKLDPIIQTGIRDGMISMGHGKALIGIESPEEQLEVYEKIIAKALSVRQTEQLVKSLKNNDSAEAPKEKSTLPNDFKKTQNDWSQKWGTKVEIKRNNKGKGKIILNFSSDADFQRLKDLLQ
ncbi:ParB/RepB/Spo0J family partition protein [Ornithobacterium rhinotracheale]|uniref:ParB-like partition protein n=1 Tax=Ornithobacterium rhinotracheale (strain ATCC 51463 / DSM 15997 / CCUG 23171 / CIP 104009 / LMG 9086) TaxID=867902 RepID=I3ZX46_ORNRL|nr:ParB/RepB/Spo0J family partition protein [Ornithobacterium rhinotracheale]AFL96280.1 ParB-like partition protein [Ornithobacterium rhinotracheale DSM 15997]AIP98514.1 chromosome partitioning protein ParB [Ornithobacterium rhinotracheale ORT-UMN 88]KGB67919.1 chromosome partitioning protein ParB [Ornithobacterium rhinotracheale H06-030791]MCK0193109.1 ParB/RepB/Spo0J family partition protein [Ornithobacterium rhinotracheale]MCK0200971.1 ParB/RepB/Spo0J family partition protein [Ornithobacter